MKPKLLSYILFFLCVHAVQVFAADVSADGYGRTEAEARANAASELSFVIYSDVRSELHAEASDDPASPKQTVTKETDITTAVPIYGADYKTEQDGSQYKCTAVLRAEIGIPVYVKEIQNAADEVNRSYGLIKNEKSSSAKYTYVMSALASFDNIRKLRAALNVLGGESKTYPEVTREQLINMRSDLTFKTDSMARAAELIASELKKDNVYVYYPMYNGSDEVTQFSESFRALLASHMKTVSSIYAADYFLDTQYSVSDKGMHIAATLTDKNGVTLGKSVKILEPKAYAQLKVEPESLSFEKLLKMGLAQSSDFSARITTGEGKRAKLYKSGDAVELFVKLNRPGYIFLVGHVDKAGERFSYIVDFYSTNGDRKFIRYIGADEVNRWVSLGEFDIVPPYGLETFQMMASVKDPIDKIPAHVFDPESELYIVSKDISEGVRKTRALRLQNGKEDAVAEDVLIFSTIDK